MKAVVVLWSVLLVGCGGSPPTLGVVVDRVGLAKTELEASPVELERTRSAALEPTRHADILGDDRLETISPLPNGRGVGITDETGTRITVPTAGYLTDLDTIRGSRRDKDDLVLLLYPDEQGTGSFVVMSGDRQEVARWSERPSPARFAVGRWSLAPAVFYLVGDEILVRRADGGLLARLPAPGAGFLRQLHVRPLAPAFFVVVASGDGYTPYHMVGVYDAAGALVFQEFGREHAFALDVDPVATEFSVTTRTSRWRYRPTATP